MAVKVFKNGKVEFKEGNVWITATTAKGKWPTIEVWLQDRAKNKSYQVFYPVMAEGSTDTGSRVIYVPVETEPYLPPTNEQKIEAAQKEYERYMSQKQGSLLKKADVPANLQKLDVPVSKEYDAVRFVYNDMVEYQIESIPWRDFQKRYQQFAQKYNKLFTEIRHNKPQVTQEDLKAWITTAQSNADNYSMEYDSYQDADTSFRDVEQLVIQINQGANAEAILAEDPVVKDYVDMVAQAGERQSGHPVTSKTVGWLRVDFVNSDWLLIDEVQSDLVNSVVQAKNIVIEPTFESFVENLTNPKVKETVLEKVSPELFYGLQRHFREKGYTVEKLDQIKNRIVELFEDWAEYGIASLLQIARNHHIKNVAIHTAETISQRDESVEADKVKMYYDNLAKSFGFKKQQLDMGELSGNFWVRTAAKLPMLDGTLQDNPKLYKRVRTDPRQESIYGPEHNEELKEFHSRPPEKKPRVKKVEAPIIDPRQEPLFDAYAAPKNAFKASLMHDFGTKEAGLYNVEDLDDFDSDISYDLMGMHDQIHLNPIRGVIPDYGSEYQAQQVWQFTFNAVKNELLPAVQQGMQKCTPDGQKKVKELMDEAVAALSQSSSVARVRQYREAGKQVEFAFGKLHSAIEVIRMETRKKRKGKPVPVDIPKSLGDWT